MFLSPEEKTECPVPLKPFRSAPLRPVGGAARAEKGNQAEARARSPDFPHRHAQKDACRWTRTIVNWGRAERATP